MNLLSLHRLIIRTTHTGRHHNQEMLCLALHIKMDTFYLHNVHLTQQGGGLRVTWWNKIAGNSPHVTSMHYIYGHI